MVYATCTKDQYGLGYGIVNSDVLREEMGSRARHKQLLRVIVSMPGMPLLHSV